MPTGLPSFPAERDVTPAARQTTRRVVLAALVLCAGAVACGRSTAPDASANGFTATWTGLLLQPKTSGNTQFDYSMTLTQSGAAVTGTAHASVLNQPQLFVNYTVSGTVSGSVLTFRELTITSQVPPMPGASWCIKEGTLTLSGDGKTLAGPWTAGGCAPGTMSLTRS
jgi:hypothetical protein